MDETKDERITLREREREKTLKMFSIRFSNYEDLFSLFLIYNSLVFLCLCKSMVS